MKKIIQEPLLHFILIGAVFFLLYSYTGHNSENKDAIIIDTQDLEEIISKFEMQWSRTPTEDELISIVTAKIEDEVFYKEALKMKLDSNDEIIKRRLSQKMKSLTKDISTAIQPSEEELKEFFNENLEKYPTDATYSFYQMFFSPDKRKEWKKEATQLLSTLNKTSLKEALTMGDPIALPQHFNKTTEFHISRQMGSEFTAQLKDLKTQQWLGPIDSGFGTHLVFIETMETKKTASFESVKEKVTSDYLYQKQNQVKASILKEFQKKYSITFAIDNPKFSEAFVSKMKTKIIED